MINKDNSVLIKILDKEFRVACDPAEKETLLQSATYLTEQMKILRGRGKVVGNDRIAITAALNVSHELFVCKKQLAEYENAQRGGQADSSDLLSLRKKVENALDCSSDQGEIHL